MTTVNRSTVVIRSAENDDFEWVANLMERTLTPFYDGNHRDHARRIFDTHISGGVDLVGHFSSGQHMFLAEVDGERAGLLHVVDKKQLTVKISPLIVLSKFRGHGVGGALMNHAINYAIDHGARQLYGTVAKPNKKALGFFLANGFRVTGMAKDHYKRGVDEYMLYKQLVPDTRLEDPNISVVPFVPELHAESARELILREMQGDFLGVDDTWVDALYAGYERRGSLDINEKFKIIFVAESGGKITGIAGATPKKGDPIKLMPLVASDEASFEALIIDLQSLLSDYGHKLYVHLVPQAWQVACLQRHGWILESVFPGGYAPNSVVQQWGHHIQQIKGVNVKNMRIKWPYYQAIMRGEKTLELRVGYDGIKKIKEGDLIDLHTSQAHSLVRIKSVRVYTTLKDVVDTEDWKQIVPNVLSATLALQTLRDIYGPDKEALGVYVFEIEPLPKK
jgi:ASC-1-like (ASCH) protein/ribosomal protein S18 acetylase RimI-like enzyme